MKRRAFFEGSLAAGALLTGSTAASQPPVQAKHDEAEVTIERDKPGQPNKGKMLAAIQPHCDDVPIFAAGTVLKLIDEGYDGILITVSDDAMAGDGAGNGEVAARNETDSREVARRLGLKEAIF